MDTELKKEMELPINYDTAHQTVRKKARETYVKKQKGKCYYCGNLLSEKAESSIVASYINKGLFPKHFFNYPVHLHHSHDSGMTIGAVHNRCNAYLWQYHGE